jgi:hypothetical protein
MTDDRRLEATEEWLFQTVRRESPDPSARKRTLEALCRADREVPPPRRHFPRPLVYAFSLAAAAAIVVGIARLERAKEPWFSATAEPVSARRAGTPEAPSVSLPASSASRPSSGPERSTRIAPPKSPPPEPSLTAEVAALDEARRALSEGDPERALKQVDDYERVLRGSRLKDEATILRIEALERSGRKEAAAKLAAEFVANNPNSPLVDRARGLVKSGHESVEARDAGGGGEP